MQVFFDQIFFTFKMKLFSESTFFKSSNTHLFDFQHFKLFSFFIKEKQTRFFKFNFSSKTLPPLDLITLEVATSNV